MIGKRRWGLAEALLEVGADGLNELGAVDGLSLNAFHQIHGIITAQKQDCSLIVTKLILCLLRRFLLFFFPFRLLFLLLFW